MKSRRLFSKMFCYLRTLQHLIIEYGLPSTLVPFWQPVEFYTLNHLYRELRMQKMWLKLTYSGFFAVILLSSVCFAGGETQKSRILDRVKVLYKAPENMQSLSLDQLQNEREIRVRDLAVIKEANDKPEVAEQKLLDSILAHDDKRLNIVHVIPEMIEAYGIEGEFKDKLLGYSSTFDNEIRAARSYVHSIDDYKSYDFRFSAVYMSMMFSFNENKEFHQKMIADMQDSSTAIGKYRKELDESYAKVEHDKYLIQNIYSVNELEQAIAAIDEEISKRQKAEL